MAAEFDKTSFGIQRRKRDSDQLAATRQTVANRLTFVTEPEKRERLQSLIAAIDEVLYDLT